MGTVSGAEVPDAETTMNRLRKRGNELMPEGAAESSGYWYNHGGRQQRDDARLLRDAAKVIDHLAHEVMAHQMGEGYEKGYEHGTATAIRRAAELCRDQSCRVGLVVDP